MHWLLMKDGHWLSLYTLFYLIFINSLWGRYYCLKFSSMGLCGLPSSPHLATAEPGYKLNQPEIAACVFFNSALSLYLFGPCSLFICYKMIFKWKQESLLTLPSLKISNPFPIQAACLRQDFKIQFLSWHDSPDNFPEFSDLQTCSLLCLNLNLIQIPIFFIE